jgi:hypothetical protein
MTLQGPHTCWLSCNAASKRYIRTLRYMQDQHLHPFVPCTYVEHMLSLVHVGCI